MKKKSGRKNVYQGLEDAMSRFYQVCASCRKKLIVHCWGNKTHKRKELVRCHCEVRGCQKYMIETSFNVGG